MDSMSNGKMNIYLHDVIFHECEVATYLLTHHTSYGNISIYQYNSDTKIVQKNKFNYLNDLNNLVQTPIQPISYWHNNDWICHILKEVEPATIYHAFNKQSFMKYLTKNKKLQLYWICIKLVG